jgi:hypothetical protein
MINDLVSMMSENFDNHLKLWERKNYQTSTGINIVILDEADVDSSNISERMLPHSFIRLIRFWICWQIPLEIIFRHQLFFQFFLFPTLLSYIPSLPLTLSILLVIRDHVLHPNENLLLLPFLQSSSKETSS